MTFLLRTSGQPIPCNDQGICSIPGCGLPQKHRGWCSKHYFRWFRHGDPEKLAYFKKHGFCGTRQYQVWAGMIARCTNPKKQSYKWYGKKGVTVCAEWMTFTGFWKDMGPSYFENASIDRIDNEQGYTPENCRWVHKDDQQRNQKRVRKYVMNGKVMTIPQIAAAKGINYYTLYDRLVDMGMSLEQALNLPVR